MLMINACHNVADHWPRIPTAMMKEQSDLLGLRRLRLRFTKSMIPAATAVVTVAPPRLTELLLALWTSQGSHMMRSQWA